MSRIQQVDLLQEISQRCSSIPYVEYGRDYDGADCWGLVYLVYRDFLGIELNAYRDNYEISDQRSVSDLISSHLDEFEEVEHPNQGDIVVAKIMGRPWHCGLFFESNIMLHTQKGIGVSIEQLNSKRWVNRVEGFHRPCS